MSRGFWITIAVIAAAAAVSPKRAMAYPQWQFSTGVTRCNQCHYAPSGGGLLTGYGRDAVGDELSTLDGNGAFLHDAIKLPTWLALGGDFRGAFAMQDVNEPSGARRAVFPMQADLQARVTLIGGLSLTASGGLRGQRRPNQDIVPYQNYQPIRTSRLVTREHYLTWQPGGAGGQGAYVRMGRFYAPFGLRLAEHVIYVRRDLGFNQLEETYNLSEGYVTNTWETHVTVFAPDFARHIGGSEAGVTAYVERRLFNETTAVAAQGRYGVGNGATRFTWGGVAKHYWAPGRAFFMAEGNLVHWTLDNGLSRSQFVGAGGVTVLPVRGVMVTMLAERNQEDLAVRSAAWNAATALINWFPIPHFEVQLMGRLQFPGAAASAKTLFFQIHYFL